MKSTNTKIVSALSFVVLSLTVFTATAMAQTAPLELADILNADIDQTVEINTNVTHPLGPLLEGMAASFDIADEDTAEGVQRQTDALNAILQKNKITFAMKNVWVTQEGYSYPELQTYVSFHAKSEDLNTFTMFTYPDYSEMIDGIMVHTTPGGGKYVGYFGDLVVITDSRENMNSLINNFNTRTTTAATLGKNPDYMEVKNKALANSFFNMYMNPAQLGVMPEGSVGSGGVIDSAPNILTGMMGLQKEFMEALKGEGVSVAQTPTGFDFSIFVKGDAAKLSQLNLQFNRYNFVPQLFRYINSTNIIMYGEENNLEGKLKDMIKIFASDAEGTQRFTDWKNELKAQGNINFDTEILPLLRGRYAMSLHKTDQIWPAVTLIVDVREISDSRLGVTAQNAGSMLTRLMDYIDKTFTAIEAEKGIDFFTRDIATYTNQSFYRLTFDPTVSPDTDPEIKNLPREKVIITVQAGVTPDGFLVITTAPNMNDSFTRDGKGLLNNISFSQAYKPYESVAGIGFLSMDNLQDYLNVLMDAFAAPADAKTFLNGLLDPWHDSYLAAYATADTAWVKGFINVDTVGLAKYQELFQTAFGQEFNGGDSGFGPESDPGFELVPAQFCDVHDSDWFAPYVEELAQNDIVGGYEDGCFRPGNEITRAEFLKMAIEATSNAGMMTYESVNYDLPSNGFPDVLSTDWYSHYVDQGVHLEWIEGYGDGTFRPNALITRAEAVTILYRVLHNQNVLDSELEMNITNSPQDFTRFIDVKTTDWFFQEIAVGVDTGLVSGVTTTRFEPNRNLNRAEAAKIILIFLDYEREHKQM